MNEIMNRHFTLEKVKTNEINRVKVKKILDKTESTS